MVNTTISRREFNRDTAAAKKAAAHRLNHWVGFALFAGVALDALLG